MTLTTVLGSLLERIPENNRVERIWKLAQVDFKKRYYNDSLGLVWALFNPLLQMMIYYFVLTQVFAMREDSFALFLFAGLLIWNGFQEATMKGANIFRTKRYLIENIQFKWIDLFYSNLLSVILGLLFNIAVFFLITLISGHGIKMELIYFPIVLITWSLLTLSVTIILGAIKPYFEDIMHIWNISLLIGFWITGIFFDGSRIIEGYPVLAYLNPFLGLIMNTRGCFLLNYDMQYDLLVYDLFYGVVLLIFAIYLFKYLSPKILEKF